MKKYKLCILNKNFYLKYPKNLYPEILEKGESRPYLVLLIQIDCKQYAIPFRSNINHKYCFKIYNDRGLKEGLDYTKALIVETSDIGGRAYLRTGTISQIDKNIKIIERDFKKFLQLYNDIKLGRKTGKTASFIYLVTTLKYFE